MTPNREPLVSVVTPVYNGESYLRQCIESVLAQTYTHWDYTIVDNCSTDGTLDIAREYAARDPRIRVHRNEIFVRIMANHNIALRQIAPGSKYCKVVAADDWIFSDCLEKMVRLAEEHPSVAIVGAYGLKGALVEWTGLPYPSTVVPGREVCRMTLLEGKIIFGAPTSVLYRSDIVLSRHAFYNESNDFNADAEVCFEFLEHHDFGFVHQVLTVRGRDREDSIGTVADTLNSYPSHTLLELVTYGARYLSEAELKRRIREQLRRYYGFLGNQVLIHRDREFWNFHRSKLAALGHPLSRGRLAFATAANILDFMLNPKSTVKELARRLRRRRVQARP